MNYYYLALDYVVLKSNYSGFEIVLDETINGISFSADLNRKVTVMTVPSFTLLASAFGDYGITKNGVPDDFEFTLEHDEDEKVLFYNLYRDVDINGFHMAVSDETIDVSINQYVVRNPQILPSIQKIKDNIIIKLNEVTHHRDYLNLINKSGLFYIFQEDPHAYLSSIYGVVLNRTNKTTLRSHNIIELEEDHLLIEEADYIAAVITKLKQTYPKVQFYNVDTDLNDSAYDEFVKYKAQLGDFQSDLLTTPVFDDPIYGSILTTTTQIEFEYHTADLVRFSRRRFDYQISKFLSDVTTCELKFPNTDRKMTFTVHWDRSQTAPGSDDLNTGTQMNESNKSHYRFASNIKLIVTIYRLARQYPAIKKVIIGTPIYMPDYLLFEEGDTHFERKLKPITD